MLFGGLYPAESAVVIKGRMCHIFPKPLLWAVRAGGIFIGKLDLSENKGREFTLKNVKFQREIAVKRDQIPFFGNDPAVCFREQVEVRFFCERKIVFLPDHEPLGLIGEKIVVVISADADNRGGAEVSLFNMAAGVILRTERKLIRVDDG